MSFKDKRRTDLRVPVNSEPFWITSALIGPAAMYGLPAGGIGTTDAGLDLILFSFQELRGNFIVLDKVCEITEAFDGSASITCGTGTMATDTAGTVSVVDATHFFASADITEATAGLYQHPDPAASITQSGTTPFAVSAVTTEKLLIQGADTTVPVIYADLTQTNGTTGGCRFHFLLARVPIPTAS